MRKIYIILLFFIFNFVTICAKSQNLTYERLIASIAYIESKHDVNLVSNDGKYVGYLQISEVAVRECNKILGYKKFKYSDRYNKRKSIEMFHIIQKHYNPKQDLHLAMRIWSEGISALKRKPRITTYIRKVLKVYQGKFRHLRE